MAYLRLTVCVHSPDEEEEEQLMVPIPKESSFGDLLVKIQEQASGRGRDLFAIHSDANGQVGPRIHADNKVDFLMNGEKVHALPFRKRAKFSDASQISNKIEELKKKRLVGGTQTLYDRYDTTQKFRDWLTEDHCKQFKVSTEDRNAYRIGVAAGFSGVGKSSFLDSAIEVFYSWCKETSIKNPLHLIVNYNGSSKVEWNMEGKYTQWHRQHPMQMLCLRLKWATTSDLDTFQSFVDSYKLEDMKKMQLGTFFEDLNFDGEALLVVVDELVLMQSETLDDLKDTSDGAQIMKDAISGLGAAAQRLGKAGKFVRVLVSSLWESVVVNHETDSRRKVVVLPQHLLTRESSLKMFFDEDKGNFVSEDVQQLIVDDCGGHPRSLVEARESLKHLSSLDDSLFQRTAARTAIFGSWGERDLPAELIKRVGRRQLSDQEFSLRYAQGLVYKCGNGAHCIPVPALLKQQSDDMALKLLKESAFCVLDCRAGGEKFFEQAVMQYLQFLAHCFKDRTYSLQDFFGSGIEVGNEINPNMEISIPVQTANPLSFDSSSYEELTKNIVYPTAQNEKGIEASFPLTPTCLCVVQVKWVREVEFPAWRRKIVPVLASLEKKFERKKMDIWTLFIVQRTAHNEGKISLEGKEMMIHGIPAVQKFMSMIAHSDRRWAKN